MTYPGFAPQVIKINLNLLDELVANVMVITDRLSGWSTYVIRTLDAVTQIKKLNLFTSQQNVLTMFNKYQHSMTLYLLNENYTDVSEVYYYGLNQQLKTSSPVLVMNTTASQIALDKKVYILDDMAFIYTASDI